MIVQVEKLEISKRNLLYTKYRISVQITLENNYLLLNINCNTYAS